MILSRKRAQVGASPRGRRRRNGLALAATAGALMLDVVAGGTANAAAGSGAVVVYPRMALVGVCLDVLGGSTANFTPVQVWQCNGSAAQKWFVNSADNTIRLSAAPNKCLDVQGGGTASGTKVDLYDCNGTGAQVWMQNRGLLVNPQSYRCLDDTNSARSGQVDIWPCYGTDNQVWNILP